MLCTHKTASSASLVLEICPQFNNSFLHQFSSIFGGNCIRINSGAKRHRKQHRKWKTRNSKQKWHNKIWLSKGHCNMHTMSTHFKNNLWRNSFNLDSHPLMFDDGASTSITNDLQDFMMKPTPITRKVKGIAR